MNKLCNYRNKTERGQHLILYCTSSFHTKHCEPFSPADHVADGGEGKYEGEEKHKHEDGV